MLLYHSSPFKIFTYLLIQYLRSSSSINSMA